MPAIPGWKRPAQPSLPLTLWSGGPSLTVYVATAHPDGRPGYTLRKYQPEQTPVEVLLDGVRRAAEALA